mmetsp:Transcript_8402/g.15564  ORF Transcript_8402/g.15564 Transcript_8402/m.15564 type:complete len:85 (-) Transcript_8402:310-564(-)
MTGAIRRKLRPMDIYRGQNILYSVTVYTLRSVMMNIKKYTAKTHSIAQDFSLIFLLRWMMKLEAQPMNTRVTADANHHARTSSV